MYTEELGTALSDADTQDEIIRSQIFLPRQHDIIQIYDWRLLSFCDVFCLSVYTKFFW